jgi:prepilin-type N-terminal cleavage/methylation domain-containing protein
MSSRGDSIELRFASQNETSERWSELTSTRLRPVALTFSGLGSSRPTSMRGIADCGLRIADWRAGARRVRAFTLLEILLALALVALLLVGLNTFVFSMTELWGKRSDVRLFDQHVRAVTRFLEHELRAAVLPPAARPNSTPIAMQEVQPQSGMTEKMVTFELPAGSRLISWPERPLPEVVCSFQARPNEGLVLLWHSRLEKNFDTDPPRETVVSPLVTGLSYDYYDVDTSRWTNETTPKLDPQGQPMIPQRMRFKFTYGKMSRDSVVSLPTPGEGLPLP